MKTYCRQCVRGNFCHTVTFCKLFYCKLKHILWWAVMPNIYRWQLLSTSFLIFSTIILSTSFPRPHHFNSPQNDSLLFISRSVGFLVCLKILERFLTLQDYFRLLEAGRFELNRVILETFSDHRRLDVYKHDSTARWVTVGLNLLQRSGSTSSATCRNKILGSWLWVLGFKLIMQSSIPFLCYFTNLTKVYFY